MGVSLFMGFEGVAVKLMLICVFKSLFDKTDGVLLTEPRVEVRERAAKAKSWDRCMLV